MSEENVHSNLDLDLHHQDERENNPFENDTNEDSTHLDETADELSKIQSEIVDTLPDAAEHSDEIVLVFNKEANEMKEISRTFSSVMSDFEGDKSAERFMEEYQKLYDALVQSHKQQRYYMVRCSNLQTDIKNNAEKVNLALHLSREDKEIINNLNQQVKQAWAEVDNLNEKERKAKNSIQSLQQEVQMLITMVESSLGIEELGKMAEKSQQEHVELENAFADLKEELEFKDIKLHEAQGLMKRKQEAFHEALKEKELKAVALKDKNKEITQKMEELDTSVKRLESIRLNMLSDNAQLVVEGEQQSKRIRSVEKEVMGLKAKLEECIQLYRKQKAANKEKSTELLLLTKQIKKMKAVNASHRDLIKNLSEQLYMLKTDLGISQNDLLLKQHQCSSLNKKLLTEMNLRERFKNEVTDKEHIVKMDRVKLSQLQTELITTQKQIDSLNQRVQSLMRMNDSASRMHIKLSQKNKELEMALLVQTSSNNEMLAEVNELTAQMKAAVECINALGLDKQKLFDRISQAITLVQKVNIETETKENLLLTLDKLNQELVGQLKTTKTNLVHMTNNCDTVKNELHFSELKNENLYLANVNFSKQSSSLAESLVTKEREISDLNGKVEHLQKEINKQQTEMVEVVKCHNETKQKVTDMESNLYYLEKLLCDKDGRIRELNIDIEKFISQRNIVSLQCIRKMEEIHFLINKNSVLEDIVKMGNDQYNQRLQDIKRMKFEILDLNRQKKCVMNKLENVDNLRSKLALANQQLVAAKARYRALEGEHPYNLHRWRHLEAREISQYEMVIKIQFLLKGLIRKTDEVTKLEGVIGKKTFVLHEMQNILKRRPCADAVRNANLQGLENRNLKRKMKALLAEKNLAQWQADEQKKEEHNLRKKLTIEQQKSINLQKSKQKLMDITSVFPRISKIAEESSTWKSKDPEKFNTEFGHKKNFLPKV